MRAASGRGGHGPANIFGRGGDAKQAVPAAARPIDEQRKAGLARCKTASKSEARQADQALRHIDERIRLETMPNLQSGGDGPRHQKKRGGK